MIDTAPVALPAPAVRDAPVAAPVAAPLIEQPKSDPPPSAPFKRRSCCRRRRLTKRRKTPSRPPSAVMITKPADQTTSTVTVTPAKRRIDGDAGARRAARRSHSPARPTPPATARPTEPRVQSYIEEQHHWQPGDNFPGVSQKHYFSDKYAGRFAAIQPRLPAGRPGNAAESAGDDARPGDLDSAGAHSRARSSDADRGFAAAQRARSPAPGATGRFRRRVVGVRQPQALQGARSRRNDVRNRTPDAQRQRPVVSDPSTQSDSEPRSEAADSRRHGAALAAGVTVGSGRRAVTRKLDFIFSSSTTIRPTVARRCPPRGERAHRTRVVPHGQLPAGRPSQVARERGRTGRGRPRPGSVFPVDHQHHMRIAETPVAGRAAMISTVVHAAFVGADRDLGAAPGPRSSRRTWRRTTRQHDVHRRRAIGDASRFAAACGG